ncbi:DsbA family protein [Anaerosporobacter sp.]|uniref:DsbA family protein n=1 Tax=Anaerosporobacter sp. TaxID=1872529 RepID=UPI00286F336D|nr:DsbA family protein [Anaerosporobacter sp.]
METKLTITQYTDPICIWCYALDPALRKIEFLIPEQVKFRSVLGLLVGDAKEIIGDDSLSGVRFAQLKTEMKGHFKEAADRGGIPISIKHMDVIRPEDVTSLPACRAVASMKLLDEHIANRYLRRIREGFHSDGLNTSDENVLRELAKEFPIDQQKFLENLKNGMAHESLEMDIAICRKSGVRAFPTMKLEYGEKSRTIQGYVDYDTLKKAIENLTDGEIRLHEREFSLEALSEYVTYFKRVAAIEIQTAFSLDGKALDSAVKQLLESGLFQMKECGESYFVYSLSNVGTCDSATGVCQMVSVPKQ